ncbi:MAG TPA: acyltransferase [Isosphaeraceae bacterium]
MPMSIGAGKPGRSLRVDPAVAAGPEARIPELDALRGIAAVVIVIFHSNVRRFPWGWAAVDLFFVLSGFLITGIVLRHGGSRGFLSRFYIRRALRIFPAYYLVVLGLVVFRNVLPRPVDPRGLIYELTYTQFLPYYWFAEAPRYSPYLGHTWTLAIEEQFYLVWPALILLAGRSRAWVAALSLATVAGSFYLRSRGYSVALLGARADGLALGGLLAAVMAGREGVAMASSRALRVGLGATSIVSAAILVALASFVGMAATDAFPRWTGLVVLSFSTLWLGVIGLVVIYSGHPRLAVLRRPRLRRIGAISYGLYLYHFLVIVISGDIYRAIGLRGQPLWREAPTIGVCFVVAALSWKYIERPILKLKDRFAYTTDEGRPAPASVSAARRVGLDVGTEQARRG